MPVNVDIDEALIAEATAVTGLSAKAAIEEALRRLIQSARQKRAIETMHGMGWEGNLDKLRRTRSGGSPQAEA